jgi:hypothetical protein
MQLTSYISPKCAIQPGTIGQGLYVVGSVPIEENEPICVKQGYIVTLDELLTAGDDVDSPAFRTSAWISPGLFVAGLKPAEVPETMTHVNHSHDPCAFMWGTMCIACRRIEPGEQVTIHYADFERDEAVSFLCKCGASNCPGWFDGNAWKDPVYQTRYLGILMKYAYWRVFEAGLQ